MLSITHLLLQRIVLVGAMETADTVVYLLHYLSLLTECS